MHCQHEWPGGLDARRSGRGGGSARIDQVDGGGDLLDLGPELPALGWRCMARSVAVALE